MIFYYLVFGLWFPIRGNMYSTRKLTEIRVCKPTYHLLLVYMSRCYPKNAHGCRVQHWVSQQNLGQLFSQKNYIFKLYESGWKNDTSTRYLESIEIISNVGKFLIFILWTIWRQFSNAFWGHFCIALYIVSRYKNQLDV